MKNVLHLPPNLRTRPNHHEGIQAIIGETTSFSVPEAKAKLVLPAIKLVLKYYFFALRAALVLSTRL